MYGQKLSYEEARRAANANLVRVFRGDFRVNTDAAERREKQRAARAEEVAAERAARILRGRKYDECKSANEELNRALRRIDVIDRQKQPSAERLAERQQLWAEAEEWQSICDIFFDRNPGSFIGHPALERDRRFWMANRAG